MWTIIRWVGYAIVVVIAIIAIAVVTAYACSSRTAMTTTTAPTCQLVPDYDKPPQPQIGHPSVYLETGVNPIPRCWEVQIKDWATLIVGGYYVDGKDGGVYKAIDGPKTVKVTVKNGFIAITTKERALDEFCFRVGQATQYGWARNTIEPLPGWTACFGTTEAISTTPTPVSEAPTTTAVSAATCQRENTGEGVTKRFNAGCSPYGWQIILDNGELCDNGECYVPNVPVGGSVTSGTTKAFEGEVPKNAKVYPWNP